jgi:hypothetical protein
MWILPRKGGRVLADTTVDNYSSSLRALHAACHGGCKDMPCLRWLFDDVEVRAALDALQREGNWRGEANRCKYITHIIVGMQCQEGDAARDKFQFKSPMLSRKQGRSFPTPDLSARLALSRQP